MRVLLVEDDNPTARSIEVTLAQNGITCDRVSLGQEGLEMATRYDYDILILDLILPDENGYELLIKIRSAKITTPVLILSGLTTAEQKIKSLGSGADDYLTKPFNRGGLIARLQAVVRRSKGHAEAIIRFHKVALNMDSKTVEVDGQHVHLTAKEYMILELLALRKNTVLTKVIFLNHLYNGLDEPEIKIIDVFVCKLRKALAKASGGVNYIETVWGRGYMLKDFGSESDSDLESNSNSGSEDEDFEGVKEKGKEATYSSHSRAE